MAKSKSAKPTSKEERPDSDGLTITRLEIHDFMRITALVVPADGQHVVITGKNTSGKTSAVDCLWAILGGKSARPISEPIKKGASKAVGVIEISNSQQTYIITKTWTAAGPTLTITAKDGTVIRRPQDLLDGLLGQFSLDPVAFIRRRNSEQVTDVLAVMGVKPPVEAVEQITGEHIDVIEDEGADEYLRRLVGDRIGMFYTRRTDAQRIANEKHQAHQEQIQAMLELGGPPTADDFAADATELHHQLQGAYQRQQGYQSLVSNHALAQKDAANASAKANQLDGEHKAVTQRIDQIQAEIDRLTEAKKNFTTLLGNKADEFRTQAERVKEAEAAVDRHAKQLHAATDPSEEIHGLNGKIQNAQEQSEQNAKRQGAADLCERLAQEHASAEEEAVRMDRIVANLRTLANELLTGLDLGIDGLAVGNGELRLNDVSFSQASHAEKLEVACAVAMRQNPALKVLRVDEGENLDSESKKRLFRIATDKGWQVFYTKVSDSQELKVEIVNG